MQRYRVAQQTVFYVGAAHKQDYGAFKSKYKERHKEMADEEARYNLFKTEQQNVDRLNRLNGGLVRLSRRIGCLPDMRGRSTQLVTKNAKVGYPLRLPER